MKNGDYGVGSIVIFKWENDRTGILLKMVESDFGVSPHWEVLMQDTGRVERVLVLNLANGRNSRYEII
tara:strand:+ start:900 stop:1103 length:204 start_codon:yes stop_codon:yes gene_type:complete